jgi:hypothetical protein
MIPLNPVARTILEQLGGNKFIVMTGAKSFVQTDRALYMIIPMGPGRGRRMFRVELADNDTYRVRLSRLRPGKRQPEVETIAAQDDVYCDMLAAVFERMTGLRTRLF